MTGSHRRDVEELVARHDLPGPPDEQLEDLELLTSELDLRTTLEDPAGAQVDGDIAELAMLSLKMYTHKANLQTCARLAIG